MDDELTLLLTLDVQAVGQEALDGVAAGLERLAAQGGLVAQAIAPLGDAFAGLFTGAAGLGAALAAGLAAIDWQGAGETLATGLRQAVDGAVATVKAGGDAAAELTALLAGIVGAIDWTVVGSPLRAFGTLLESALLQPAEQALGSLSEVVGAAFDGIAEQCRAALQGAAGAIATAGPGELAAATGDVLAAVAQALQDFGPEALAQGTAIVDGLWQGIDSRAGWLAAAVPVWLAANILTPVQTFFGIVGNGSASSASTVMAGIGADLGQGLMDGMNSLAGALLSTASELIAPLVPAVEAYLADFRDAGSALMDSLSGGIQAKAGEIADQARAVVQGAIDAARSVLNGIQAGISAAQAGLSAALAGGQPAATGGGSDGAAAVGHNAGGTDNWRGGLTWVGENGPELVNLPGGAQVIPLSGPAALPPYGAGSGPTVNVYVTGNTVLSEQDTDLLASRVGQAIVRQTGLAYSLVR